MPGGGWGGNTGAAKAPVSGSQLRAGGWGANAGTSAPAPSKGGGNVLGNLFHDAESTLSNIPAGVVHAVEHPIATAKDIGHSYARTYGPLFQGRFGTFFHGIEQHPLGPILDAATLATLGAGGVARAGELLGKAGVISDTSKLATLAHPADLTVPDFAKSAGQGGEDLVVKQTSANPLIRARQQAVNAGLNKLPAGTPVVGSSARAVKVLSREPERAAARVQIAAQPFTQAFSKLSPAERAAWHLSARGVDPAAYKTFLAGQPKASPAMLKILENPKVADLVSSPTPRLQDALDKGRALSDQLTQMKVGAGHISEQAAAESPYRLLRMMSGATIVPHEAAAESPALKAATVERDRIAALHEKALASEEQYVAAGPKDLRNKQTPSLTSTAVNEQLQRIGEDRPTDPTANPNAWRKTRDRLVTLRDQLAAQEKGGQPNVPAAANPHRDTIVRLGHALEIAQQKVDRLTTPTPATGVVGGKPIDELAAELDKAGRQQPFYVPDSAETVRGLGRGFKSKATGLSEPAASGASKQNLGVLASRGMLAVHEDPLTREMGRFGHFTEASLLHGELVKHAAELPKGEPLPGGYDYLKLNRGEPAAPYTERVGSQFEHALDPGTVGKTLTKDASDADIATSAAGHRLVVPESVRQILGDRSLSYHGVLNKLLYNQSTNVWKHLVLGLRPAFFGNITLGNSILGALQMAPGRHGVAAWVNQVVPGAEHALGSKLTPETLAKVMPEQAAGTFGHSTGFTANRGLNLAQKAYQGVMPATIAYENVLRRAMAEGWAKSSGPVRDAMKKNGGDINAALEQVAKTHPHVINEISKRVDDALGNYRTYNGLERGIRQLIPFYGWDRHIVRSVARLVSERPAVIEALTKLGAEGQETNDKTVGPLPTFLQGAVKLPGLPSFMGPTDAGRVPLLTTHSANPFNSVADLLRFTESLGSGQAGAHSEELSSGLNPIVQSLIEQMTGRSLLTGGALPKNGPHYGEVGNTIYNTLAHLPQSSLVATAVGKGTPTKPSSLYQHDLPTALAAFLGVPIKKTNPQAAANIAKLEGVPKR